MNAAILSPGPSLFKTWRGGTYDHVIGVNRASIFFECDTWAAMDWISEHPGVEPGGVKHWAANVKGSPDLLIGSDGAASLQRSGIPWRGRVIHTESWWTGFDYLRLGWSLRTFTTALMYAAHLGATAIDIYGADMAGTCDADGAVAGHMRTADRWKSEREVFENCVRWLNGRNISVERINEL